MTPRLLLPAIAERDQRALRLGAWVLGPALLFALVVRPSVSALLDSRAALASERALLGRELSLVAEAPRDRQLLRAAEQAVDATGPRLFGGGEAVSASAELARYVARQATESGLTLEQTETETALDSAAQAGTPNGGTSGAPAATPLRVSIRAHGEIEAVAAFLQAIERGPRLVRVDQVAITLADTTVDGSLAMTATLSGLARNDFLRAVSDSSAPIDVRGAAIAARGAP